MVVIRDDPVIHLVLDRVVHSLMLSESLVQLASLIGLLIDQ